MERNSQSTTFSQHEKARFNIRKLKSRLNKRACVRGFFETHYRNTKSSTEPAQREEALGRHAFPDKCVGLIKERARSLCTQTGKTHAPRRSRQEPKNQNQTHAHESKQPHKPDEEATEPARANFNDAPITAVAESQAKNH